MNAYNDLRLSQALRFAAIHDAVIGHNFTVYRTLDTTMRVADQLINDREARDGLTIIALEQTAGRGSGNRKWVSCKGNAMFSRIVRIAPHMFGQEIEIIAALSIATIFKELLPHKKVSVKYPNDILIDGEKISGCLVPPSYDLSRGKWRYINLGVGVNLSVAPGLANGKVATCLKDHGVEWTVSRFISEFESKFVALLADYHKRADFRPILVRAGFCNAKGSLTLRHNTSGKRVSGIYKGFVARAQGSKRIVMLKLSAQECVGRRAEYSSTITLPVHDYMLHSTPLRSSSPAHRLKTNHAYAR